MHQNKYQLIKLIFNQDLIRIEAGKGQIQWELGDFLRIL